MQHGGEPFFGAFFAPPVMPSVVTFRAALALSTAHVPLLSSRAAYAVYGGEPFFGASFAPPAMPSVVSFRAALYLRPTSLSSLLVLLMQHGSEPFFGASFAPSVVSFRSCRPLSTAHVSLLSSCAAYAACTEVSPSSALPLRPL